jgi:Calcineurin-like phosphoesterase
VSKLTITISWKTASLPESNNVIRKHTTVSIGDLNGNYGALLWNLSSTEIIDNSHNWKGWDTKVILHGDIFADRYPHSIDIANYITKLQNQARLQGGDIIILAWNHEDMAFSYLTGEPIIYIHGKWYPMQIDSSKEAQPWLMELESHINPGITLEEIKKNRGKLLGKMRLNLEWRETLEFICNMKLIDRTDDTIRIHVLPHTAMLELIMKIGVDAINTLYQKWMRYHLFREWTMSIVEQLEFRDLRKVFLDLDHRKIVENDIYKELKKDWINLIISGHDTSNSGEITDMHWVICTGVDFGYWMPQRWNKDAWLKKRELSGRKKKKLIRPINDRRDPSRDTNTLVL